jgi:hypothetical protein
LSEQVTREPSWQRRWQPKRDSRRLACRGRAAELNADGRLLKGSGGPGTSLICELVRLRLYRSGGLGQSRVVDAIDDPGR